MHTELDLDFFATRLNSAFGLACAPGIELVLFEVSESAFSGPGRRGFSLMFRGPLDPQLEQMSHALTWPGVQSFDIFLVPVARKPDGMHYQAIFN